MSDLPVFARRMKEAREKCGLKQKELAEKIGVTPQTISAYEKTGKVPTLDNAVSIARALNVSLDWLCCVSGEQVKDDSIATLGDIARFLHGLTTGGYGNALEECKPASDTFSLSCGPGIIFEKDEIGAFLSDDLKMRNLLYDKTFDDAFYGRWLSDRIQSLDAITSEEYLKRKYPF